MATNGLHDVQTMEHTMRMFQEDLMRAEKASKGTAENFTQLAWQIKYGQKNIRDYIGESIKLKGFMKEAAEALVSKPEEVRKRIAGWKDSLSQAAFELQKQEDILSRIRKNATRKRAIQMEEVAAAHQLLDEQHRHLKLEQSRLELTERMHGVTGKALAAEFLLGKIMVDSVRRSGQLNDAVMHANSLSKERYALTDKIWQVQAKTGASLDNMLAASRALTSVWPKMRNDFQSTLEVMVEMEEGLGVSYENSAEMARVFEISLKTSAREVADRIAVIANSTSLMADEATRFSTEIGKALRLLGPGNTGGVKDVAGYVTMMAARMKDVGGDANEIVKMFSEMTKGTQQAFMLRSLARVGSPGALKTQPGAQAAVENIGRLIDKIVTAAPGTMAYVAQLEAASQIMGTSVETVRLYRDMLEKSRQPLDEHAKLEARWREQVENANKAIGRLRESFVALIQRAFVPLMPIITHTLGALAKIVSFLASNRIAVWAATTAIVIGVAKAVYSLTRLTIALMRVTAASMAAARAESLRSTAQMSLPGIGGKAGRIETLSKFLGKPGALFTVLRTGLFTPIGQLAKTFGWLGPGLAVLAAGAAGYGLGTLIQKAWPNNWIAQLAYKIGEAVYSKSTASTANLRHGDKAVWEIMADIRKAIVKGNEAEAFQIFQQGKYRVKGLETEKGAQAYIDRFVRTMAETREQIGLSSVTVGEKETLKNDKRLIELTQEQVKLTGGAQQLMRDVERQRKSETDRKLQDERTREMINYVQYRLQADNAGPTKVTLTPGGAFKITY